MSPGKRYLNKIHSNTTHVSCITLERIRRKLALKRNQRKLKNRLLFKCVRDIGEEVRDAYKSNKYILNKVPYEALNYEVIVDTDFGRELQMASKPSDLFFDCLSQRDDSI